MKFTIYMKDPDWNQGTLEKAVEDSIDDESFEDEEEKEMLKEHRVRKLIDFMEPWLEYEECVTIEFDTEAGTAIVLKKG